MDTQPTKKQFQSVITPKADLMWRISAIIEDKEKTVQEKATAIVDFIVAVGFKGVE